VARVLHNLSGIVYYRHRGETAEYERLVLRALAIREAALPKDDLDLAGTREALALLRRNQGRLTEAAAQGVELAVCRLDTFTPPDFVGNRDSLRRRPVGNHHAIAVHARRVFV
jgi:hypothetical protein